MQSKKFINSIILDGSPLTSLPKELKVRSQITPNSRGELAPIFFIDKNEIRLE